MIPSSLFVRTSSRSLALPLLAHRIPLAAPIASLQHPTRLARALVSRPSASFFSTSSILKSDNPRRDQTYQTHLQQTLSPATMSRLQGKNVFITGASSGIGEACARHFAQAGTNLILAARRKERLAGLKSELESKHPNIKISIYELDVRQRANVNEVTAQFEDHVDVLVNNAGLVIGLDKLEDITEEALDTMMDTNVKGLVHVTQAVLPGMKKRNKGHIINIGSVAGQQPYANGSIYCATKAAVAAISRALMAETVDTQIRVSEINPGLVETEFSVVRFRGDKNKADSVYKGLTPLNGDDIAEMVVFVAGRPDHVNIAEMLVFPTNQAGATIVHRQA
ncbi:hypothetical protein BGW42_005555 [Actinomortierella wolfii]|nr:hypothetical protein BGW42_005555 [Actinomortierella wolfii]